MFYCEFDGAFCCHLYLVICACGCPFPSRSFCFISFLISYNFLITTELEILLRYQNHSKEFPDETLDALVASPRLVHVVFIDFGFGLGFYSIVTSALSKLVRPREALFSHRVMLYSYF